MKQQFFEERGRQRWQRLGALIDALEAGSSEDTSEFPHLYRRTCQDLALARDRGFSGQVVESLNHLALRGHKHLYGARASGGFGVSRFVSHEFPAAVRAEWRLVVVATLLFFGTGLATGLLGQLHPDLIYSFIETSQVESMERMYQPGNGAGEGRASEDNTMMFGFYIWNNISIAFRTFAGGLMFGIGTLFVLSFNGVYMGLIASHLTRAGFGETFYPFVIGHGAFELTAILFAGVAGMRLGLALVAPGPRSRLQALRNAGLGALPIVYGSAGMLLIAAGVEAFWSPSAAPPVAKYTVGTALWIFVVLYFVLAGRRRAD